MTAQHRSRKAKIAHHLSLRVFLFVILFLGWTTSIGAEMSLRPFPAPPLFGDVNDSGTITILDATII